MSLKKTLGALIVFAGMTGASQAAVILPGSEQSLQSIINGMYCAAPPCPTQNGLTQSLVSQAPNVNTNQATPAERWIVEASGNATATFIIEIAGLAASNIMGLYDPFAVNPSATFVPLFGLGDNTGQRAVVLWDDATNQFSVSYFSGISQIGSPIVSTFSSAQFGFYLTAGGNTFYSESARNPGGAQQLVAFAGDGDNIRLRPGSAVRQWGSSSYILAWEDLPYATSDRDFNDFVFYMESITPMRVPEPGTLALLSLGLAGLAVASRRRRSN